MEYQKRRQLTGIFLKIENFFSIIFLFSLQPKLKVIKKESVEEKLSKLASVSGMSINMIVNCDYLRQSFENDGTPMPESANTIRILIIQYAKTAKKQIANKIQLSKYISICADEWTSSANLRYLNVCAHTNDASYNLGLVPIKNSATASNISNLIIEKLAEFEIEISKCVVFCSDGATTMKAVARNLGIPHTICFCHTLQLAVCDSIYKEKIYSNDESDSESEHSDEENDFEENDFEPDIEEDSDDMEYKEKYSNCIKLVRQIVKFFTKSPKNSEILANFASRQENTNSTKLVLDCKTRWSSMLLMLEKFLLLAPSIKMALIETKSKFEISNHDLNHISNIVSALKPFEEAVKYMSKDRSNLFDAMGCVNFIKKSLASQKTSLSSELLSNFLTRIENRMNDGLVDFSMAMQNPTLTNDNSGMLANAQYIATQFIEKFEIGTVEPSMDENIGDGYIPKKFSIESEKDSMKYFLQNFIIIFLNYFFIFCD